MSYFGLILMHLDEPIWLRENRMVTQEVSLSLCILRKVLHKVVLDGEGLDFLLHYEIFIERRVYYITKRLDFIMP